MAIVTNKGKAMIDRRKFIQAGVAAGLASSLPFRHFISDAYGLPAADGLSNPADQPLFAKLVPDALAPGFKYVPDRKGQFKVQIREAVQQTGLLDKNGNAASTRVWGYADQNANKKVATWPGKTFEIKSGQTQTVVTWANSLKKTSQHLLPVDTNLHWCYALHGYEGNTIANAGIPTITHLHGGHSDFQYDGNPEFFYSPDGKKQIVGPQWANVPGGFTKKFVYDNDVPAGNLWYHDHALGITRLNVYAGLAGFYFVRDGDDTGGVNNPLGLPAWPYEKAYAIQDRMFTDMGALFYSAYPGDPFYDDFITGEGAILPEDLFPLGGPTALAEFFGDHMVVNGKIWPYEPVEPRPYRLHLLNGTDSRFMQFEFREVLSGDDNPANGTPFPFDVIGSDQGLAAAPTIGAMSLLSEPGSRYDVIVDFGNVTPGNRVIMTNLLGDAPYGGDLPTEDDRFPDWRTDRIMAFEVTKPLDPEVAIASVSGIAFGANVGTPTRTRKVALFEGLDEFGRLQPLLGTAEPATDKDEVPIEWPNDPKYSSAGLVGQMSGAIAWHSPTTENPELNAIEEWEVWNATGDAHPVHLHLVHFEVIGRQEIVWDSATNEDDRVLDPTGVDAPAPNGDGTYLVSQPTVQHNSVTGDMSTYGHGFKMESLTYGAAVPLPDGIVENTPKDMVTALPGQITRIKAKFDKPGRYVWHCHILSHEDHEMMRVLHVGPGA